MKYHYYIPFCMVFFIITFLRFLIKNPDPKSRWVKYFGNGFTRQAYSIYMDNIKTQDKQTYWIMLLSSHGMFFSLLGLLFI